MRLEEYRPPVKLKLAALWTSTMFCYVYGDYFGLFVKGALLEMNRGIMGPLGPATPAVLVGVSIMMAVPSLSIVLSLLLPASVGRWTNIVLGLAYTGVMAVTLSGSKPFYIVFGIVEMALTLAVVVVAWRWPRVETDT
jgi:hypothetical protein